MYVMAAIYEAETERISDIMRVSSIRLEGIRKSLLDGFVESQKRIEDAIPAIIDDAQRALYDAPRGEVAGARFNMPKKMLLAVARFIDPARPDAPALFDRLANMRYADGTQVLKTSNPEDERIRRALDSARGGTLYAKPLEIAEAISAQTESLTEVGRRVIAREEDTENKTELIDELTVALSTDCARVHEAVATLAGDREFPRLPYGEKISRLRMLKLRQAINTSGTRSTQQVEDYARDCTRKTGNPVEGRLMFAQNLPQQFPGLYFTEEDSRFFYDTVMNTERYREYRRLGYC